ncbi:MAG: hypothetical protein ACXVHX_37850 [Solirubrobacteraceae bacterium]
MVGERLIARLIDAELWGGGYGRKSSPPGVNHKLGDAEVTGVLARLTLDEVANGCARAGPSPGWTTRG